jgi:L-lactate dehydrogenase complex protein LldG
MSSRDRILERIRRCGPSAPFAEPAPVPEVWPPPRLSRAQLVQIFVEELHAVGGEDAGCATVAAAGRKLREMTDDNGWRRIGVMDRPLCRDLAAALPPDRVVSESADPGPRAMAALPVCLVEADRLLADTGSCVVAARTATARRMCYLPPCCIVAARAETLFEHLPAAWERTRRDAAAPGFRGEIAIITGPGRTADIEKRLVLGVHGPRRLIVLLIG